MRVLKTHVKQVLSLVPLPLLFRIGQRDILGEYPMYQANWIYQLSKVEHGSTKPRRGFYERGEEEISHQIQDQDNNEH